MTQYYKVSIIIPLKEHNSYINECIEHCLELDYPDYEIIVLPDNRFPENVTAKLTSPKIKIIPTGAIGPSEKRDIGMAQMKGDIVAFLDDDTYPVKEWLKNAILLFTSGEIAAVCGPAVTPESDNLMQKAGGAVYESFMASGQYTYRYLPKSAREVDDYPSCNFIVRKSIIDKIGGFANTFWPGEDTVLCLKITKELKKKIIYSPDVLVYHHRRPLFKKHLDQVGRYGLHRGYFVKKFPQTSFRLSYFIPSLFVLGIAFLLAGSFFCIYSVMMLAAIMIIYIITSVLSISKKYSFKLIMLSIAGIFSTHIVYGLSFIKGLIVRNLKR